MSLSKMNPLIRVGLAFFALVVTAVGVGFGIGPARLWLFSGAAASANLTPVGNPEPAFFTLGTCDTAGPIEIESSGGTTTPTAYATLTASFAAINAGTHTGSVVIEVCGNSDEGTGSAVLNASGSGAASYTAVTIKPVGGVARTITGATTAGSPLIDFNGADNVTVDGLNTGGNSLTISNTTVSATSGTATIRFIGGATTNLITNSTILGAGTMSVATNGATIFFSTDANTANGNDNNTISNNNIGPVGANLPTKGILCNGSTTTTAIGNSGLIIDNNNIFDYFGAAVTSAGIATNGGCNTWTITNNRLYQTGTRTWTTGALHAPIFIANSTSTSGAQGFTITGNIIGYASNSQTGTYTLTGNVTGTRFNGIFYNGISTGAATTISNNTIAAVNVSGVQGSGTSTGAAFAGILFQEGNGITNGNTIGSQTGTGSLTFSTTTTSASDIYGIFNFSSNAWTANNNNIGGISATNLGASGTFVIYGLRANTATTAPWTATGNNVGGTTANSIQLTATGTSSQVIGMNTSNAPAVFTSNTIRNLTTNIGTGVTTGASLIGINITTSTPNHTVSQNTISNLTNTNATAASIVTGLQITGATANVVERNSISGISSATNSAAAEVNGIRVGGGTTVYRNNFIALGAGTPNALGAAATNGGTTGVNGINEFLGTNSFFHNSVYIGGAATAGTGASFAFNGSQTVSTRSFRDNIFFNARSNAGATGKNYAVKINGTAPNPSGLTINNNVYFANGSGAAFGFFNSLDVADLNAWKTAVGQDTASFEANPQFVDPTNAVPDLHLHPTNSTVAEGNGADVGVTNDFDGQLRAGLTPTDIGADAGNFTGVDLSAPSIAYTGLANSTGTGNRNLSPVTITDVTGVASGGNAPRVYYKKNAGTYFSSACSLTSGTSTNGQYSCTIVAADMGGLVTGDTISYFVIAQDTVGNVGSNPSAGLVASNVNTVATAPTSPNSYLVATALSGTKTVCASGCDFSSLTGTNGIFNAINTGVATGNINIEISSDLTGETGAVGLNAVGEEPTGSNFNVRIYPTGGPRVITGATPSNALIRTIGASRVTIDGSVGGTGTDRSLTITNTSATSPQVVRFGSVGTTPITSDALKNCIVINGVNTSSAVTVIDNAGAAGYFNNVAIQNNDVQTAFIGIFTNAVVQGANGSGLLITQNKLDNSGASAIRNVGVYVQGADGATVSNNSIGNFNVVDLENDTGIWLATGAVNTTVSGNSVSTLGMTGTSAFAPFGIRDSGGAAASGNNISNNTVSNLTTSGSTQIFGIATSSGGTTIQRNNVSGVINANTGTFGAYGIDITAGNNVVVKNNFVSNVTGDMTGGAAFSTQFGIFGIRVGAGTGHIIANNSVNLYGARTGTATTSLLTAALGVVGTTSTGLDVRNNILANNITGGTTSIANVAVYLPSVGTSAMNLTWNNNSYYFGTDTARAGAGQAGTTAGTNFFTTLPLLAAYSSTLSAAGTNDNTSLAPAGSVPFATSTDLHITTGAPEANTGVTIASVTNDIDGDLRFAPYEIGADEFPDVTAPDTQILSNPTNPSTSNTATFTFSGTDSAIATVASFDCKLDAGAFSTCTSPRNYTSLSQGPHTFQVRAVDAAGNVDQSPASYTWTVDALAPDTQILTNPTNPSNSNSATFTFSGTDSAIATVASFECKLDAGAFVACTSPQTYTGLSQGSHNFQVRAIDAAGNVDPTPASFIWTVDAIAPDTQILTNPTNPSSSSSATFTFNGTDTLMAGGPIITFQCKLDGGSFATCTSPQTYTGLADGPHTFQVRSVDIAGNVDPTPASFTWTISSIPTGPVAVSATAGTPGPTNYPTLKDAFDAINAGTHQGVLTVVVVQDTTETASAVLNESGSGSASYTSVSIQPIGGGSRTVSGNVAGPLVDLNGADNVTINGLNSGGNGLTLSNTSQQVSASTIRFTNDASNNTVTNTTLAGSSGAALSSGFGVVYFATGTVTGNDNNTITGNNITAAGSAQPINGVYSFGTSAAIDNSGNTISNNNISDYFNTNSASSGISVNTGSSGWTITNNKFFQTATRTYLTAATHSGINVLSGSGYTISGNTVGFANSGGTGVYTMAGTVATRFVGIGLTVGTAADTSVQGNTVASIALATSSGAATTSGVLCGLNITSGNVNVGNLTPNTFGSTTGTGSLSVVSTTTQAAIVGVHSGSVNTVVISNNTFGAFTSASPTAAIAGAVFGVNVSGAATSMTITGNTIGNATADNMRAGVLGTTTGSSLAGGINQTAVPAVSNYSNNTIRNLSSYGTGTGGYVRGIQTSTVLNTTAVPTINNNTITNLTTSGAVSGQTSANTAALGIQLISGTGASISGNTISNITALNSGAVGTVVAGITHASAINTVISNNLIFGLSNASTATSTTAPGVITGVLIRSGTTNTTVQNNMIALGTAQATNSAIFGIWANHGSTPDPADRIYFNSVDIEGTVTSGAQPSAAFHRGDLTTTAKSPVVDVRNNIFVNNRSGGTGKHYAIANHIGAAASVATGWTTVNNNVLNAANPATVGFWTTDQTFAGWKAASSGDLLSFSGITVTFVNSASDLHLNMGLTPTPIESGGATIAGVTTDIDGQTRPGPAGSTNGGAFAPDLGADEFDGVYLDVAGPVISYTALANTPSTTNRTLSINVLDGTGVASGANLPRVYFKKSTDASYVSTACTLTGGNSQNGTYDCSIDYTLVGGGSATTFDSIQYFVVAQDTLGNVSANPGAGFTGTGVNSVTTPPTSPNFYFITGNFSGTYTVGAGGTFTSLTNAGGIFNQLNVGTVSGNVTINIVSDLSGETGANVLNEIPGGFTVTIKPSGAARTITGTSPTTSGLIGFSGADGVTIDGSLSGGTDRSLTITAANTASTGGGIYFASGANGAQNNVVKNVNVFGNGSTTGLLLGVTFAGNTFGAVGADNDNNRIENCDIRGAFYGIASLGASTANKDTGTVITRNIMPSTGTAGIGRVGIYVINNDGAQITQNSIASVSNPGSLDTIGIAAGSQGISNVPLTTGGISNALISRNYVGVVSNNATFSAAGIVVASDVTGTNNITNNMVTGVTGNSNAGDIVVGIYVNPLAGSTQNVYHNSVSMTGDRGSATTNLLPSYALVVSADQPVNVVDNALFNSQTHTGATGGGGESYAIGFDGPAANVNLLSNYNDLFVSGPIGVVGITGDLTTAAQTTTAGTGTNQTTITAWRTATSEDANSISVDPLFTSLTDLHISTGGPLVNVGTSVGVTVDFDGQTRDATPDIGADEIIVVAVPGTLAFSASTTSVGEASGTASLTVNRTGGSNGAVGATYTLGGGTATGGASCTTGIDYLNAGGTVSFADGETSKVIMVQVCPDSIAESNETFNVTLSAPTGGAMLGSPNPATVLINDLTGSTGDFDGDGRAELAVIRTNTGSTSLWSIRESNGGAIRGYGWGLENDIATPADFDGDGKMDIAVWRAGAPSVAAFYILNSSTLTVRTELFGQTGDNPVVVADYDGDGKADPAVYRGGAQSFFYYRGSLSNPSGNVTFVPWGTTGDRPAVGDFDGNGKADFAINRGGQWWILRDNGSSSVTSYGTGTDKLVPADYDGDGKTDIAVFRPSNTTWYILQSSTSSSVQQAWGLATDVLVPADYDGDGKTDLAVYRGGTWFLLSSLTGGYTVEYFGNATDYPVANAKVTQ